ncbi:MAG: hypothetical protein HQ547_02955 [Candidatus Omnitrophica bacterium]|nr:hypothetical protein [Candidatus Omnitrophota bacterium]
MLKTGVSYFGSRIQRHVKEDMQDIKDHNCNFVVHTFSETDLEFYKGTMKEIVEISHGLGLEVWVDPWAVGGVFGGEAYSKFVAVNLEAREISAKGESLPAACLNNAQFRDFMLSWIDAALELKPDVFFWDEPHFYLYPLDQMERDSTLWACRCEVCRREFKKRFGYEMPVESNDDIKLFKEDSIIDFLKTMCEYVKNRAPKTENQEPRTIKNAVCFLPFKGSLGGIMDWSKAAAIKSLDIIGTDPYWKVGEKDVGSLVRGFSKKIYDLAQEYNKEGQIWILNFRIKKGTHKDIKTAVMAAHKEGIRNIAAWSYLGTGCMSYLASDDPQGVWDTLGEAFFGIQKPDSL